MNRTEIQHADIRIGDTVEREYAGLSIRLTATFVDKYCIQNVEGSAVAAEGTWFLLNRPEPAVELPTVPTLGWITHGTTAEPELGVWVLMGEWLEQRGGDWIRARNVTAFTPAIAVSAEALDALRDSAAAVTHMDQSGPQDRNMARLIAIDTFLEAVDKAAQR